MMASPKTVRCAIYTRKSSEEGLEQEFNSLDAQREACEAYVVSQKNEGWKVVKMRYDDGGFSGGSLDRPALQRLLDDIERKVIDVVVVYKVDRLTRSLLDFAKIVARFDENAVSFVAVTQHFNTTSSMGRLTLNVLLSFAQFEREVTGERIRDKIAASKKKGMWMGGPPPLGYDLKDRKLIVNEQEAERVRTIYERYLAVGSVSALVQDLRERGILSKSWVSEKGIRHGGNRMGRGALYRMLQNRLYLGEVVHRDQCYPGEHEAILPRGLWERVQQALHANRREHAPGTQRTSSLLEGLVYDDRGNAMTPHYAQKAGRKRYRYYVTGTVLAGDRRRSGAVTRIPAAALEELIEDRLARWTDDGNDDAWAELGQNARQSRLREHVRRIEVGIDEVAVEIHYGNAKDSARWEQAVHETGDYSVRGKHGMRVAVSIRLKKRGGETIITRPNGEPLLNRPLPNVGLIKNLVTAFRWREQLERGEADSIAAIADSHSCTERYVRKILPLAFLAPDIVESVLDGVQPRMLTLDDLTTTPAPLDWTRQRAAYGFASVAES